MSTAERRELLLDFKRRCESDERAAHEMLAADALLGMTLLLAQLEMGSVDEEALHAAARDAKAASAAARPDGDGARASAGQVDAKPTQPQHVELIKQVSAHVRPRAAPPRPRSPTAALLRPAGDGAHAGDDAGTLAVPAAATIDAAASHARTRRCRNKSSAGTLNSGCRLATYNTQVTRAHNRPIVGPR